jgi:hypothetical protein
MCHAFWHFGPKWDLHISFALYVTLVDATGQIPCVEATAECHYACVVTAGNLTPVFVIHSPCIPFAESVNVTNVCLVITCELFIVTHSVGILSHDNHTQNFLSKSNTLQSTWWECTSIQICVHKGWSNFQVEVPEINISVLINVIYFI